MIFVCPDCGHRYKAEVEGCDECADRGGGLIVGKANVGEVLDWVGDDPGAAAQALEAEQEGRGRVSLIDKLQRIAEGSDA